MHRITDLPRALAVATVVALGLLLSPTASMEANATTGAVQAGTLDTTHYI